MSEGNRRSPALRFAARLLAAALVVASPGLEPYRAFAQSLQARAASPRAVAAPFAPVRPAVALSGAALSPAGPSLALPGSLAAPHDAASASAAAVAEPVAAPLPAAAEATSGASDAGGALAAVPGGDSAPASRASASRRLLGPLRSFAAALRSPDGAFGFFDGGLSLRVLEVPAGVQDAAEEPSLQAIQRALDEISKAVRPGQSLERLAQRVIANRLGLSEAASVKVLERLVERKHLAVLSEGAFLYTDIVRRQKEQHSNPGLRAGNGLALLALENLNKPGWEHQARALAQFTRALGRYGAFQGATGVEPGARAQVSALRDDAAIGLLRETLRRLHAATVSAEGAKSERAARVQDLLHWADAAIYTVDDAPAAMPDALHADLMALLSSLEPESERMRAEGPEVVEGMRLLLSFMEDLRVQRRPVASAGKPAPPRVLAAGQAAALSEEAASFPLIAKEDSAFKALNTYGENLSRKAVEGGMEPLIGRRDVIRQMVKTLLRRKKNNPILIGDGGVGKTAIAEGLARMIVEGDIPQLAGRNVVKLDLTRVLAGTRYRGDFEERMKAILDEVRASKGKALLFIDEIHMLVNTGATTGSHDAAQLLKEALANGDLALVGATTYSDYRLMEKDKALVRRFQPIPVSVPTIDEGVAIVQGVKPLYEKQHGVTIAPEVAAEAVRLAARYIKDRSLPDSALDLLDDAAAEVRLKADEAAAAGAAPAAVRRQVLPEDLAFEVNLRTGIPVKSLSRDDREALLALPEELSRRVIGQPEAVSAVVRAIRRGRLGYKEAKQPIGTFVFLGPTGVGKTEVARVLAKMLFRSEKSVVRIDMSEYMEKHSVSRLISAPPGYTGYEDGGQLTEPVRNNPYSVILFDEIEKAAPEVLDVLLQVIEDGRLTDGQGRVVDFSNTIIILTSNIGGSVSHQSAEPKRHPIGFIWGEEDAQPAAPAGRYASYLAAFKARMRPEFFNRIGKRRVIVFNELNRLQLDQILSLRLADLNERLAAKGMTARFTDAARERLLSEATSAENRAYGARPLKQAIEEEVEEAMVQAELAGTTKNGDALLVDFDPARGLFVVTPEPRASLGGAFGFGLAGLGTALAGVPGEPWILPVLVGAGAALYFAARRPALPGPARWRGWAPRLAGWAGAFLALDWATKFLVVASDGPWVPHPIDAGAQWGIAAAMSLAAGAALYLVALAHAVEAQIVRAGAVPFAAAAALRRAVGGMVVAAAGLIAGAVGNGVEGLLHGRVVDFLPLGHARFNVADVLLFFGVPFAWMTLDFLRSAQRAVVSRLPLEFKSWKHYLWTVLALGTFMAATESGYAQVPSWAWYVAIFATLGSAGIMAADVFLHRAAEAFNAIYRPSASPGVGAGPAEARLSAAYLARKRVAAALAALGLTLGAPRLSPADFQAFERRFDEAPPKLVILDYDDTFMDNSEGRGLVVTPERVKLLEDLHAAGIRVAFATNRPLDGGEFAMSHLLLDRLPESLRAGFLISTGGGAAVYRFGPRGEKPESPAFVVEPFSETERAAIRAAMADAAALLAFREGEYSEQWRDSEYVFLLMKGPERGGMLRDDFRSRLERAGVRLNVTLKQPANPALAPYIRVSKADKAQAVAGILRLLAGEGVRLEPEDVLIAGDDFTVPGYDSAMARALPGATVLAVGQGADPALGNVFLSPEPGPEQTARFLRGRVKDAGRDATTSREERP